MSESQFHLTAALFFVRDRTDLTEALDVTPTYLRTKEADAGSVIDYRNWQLSLGRRFRSIKLWFVLRSYGVEGLQNHLRNGIQHCDALADIVRANSDFEIVAKPSLALLCFRLVRPGLTEDELNELNKVLHSRLEHRTDLILTQTVLKSAEGRDMFCIRFAMGVQRTTMQDVQEVWTEVVKEAGGVLTSWRG